MCKLCTPHTLGRDVDAFVAQALRIADIDLDALIWVDYLAENVGEYIDVSPAVLEVSRQQRLLPVVKAYVELNPAQRSFCRAELLRLREAIHNARLG